MAREVCSEICRPLAVGWFSRVNSAWNKRPPWLIKCSKAKSDWGKLYQAEIALLRNFLVNCPSWIFRFEARKGKHSGCIAEVWPKSVPWRHTTGSNERKNLPRHQSACFFQRWRRNLGERRWVVLGTALWRAKDSCCNRNDICSLEDVRSSFLHPWWIWSCPWCPISGSYCQSDQSTLSFFPVPNHDIQARPHQLCCWCKHLRSQVCAAQELPSEDFEKAGPRDCRF